MLAWSLLGALSQALTGAEVITGAASSAFPSVQDGASARAIAMASTYVGIGEGSATLLWNPAGLGGLDRAEVALHHNTALLGASQQIAVLGLPMGAEQGLGLSLGYEDNGVFEGRDATGALTGDYSARAFGASLGWGFEASNGLALGMAVKAQNRDLAGTVSSAFAGDIGALWTLRPELRVGVAYTNLGPDVGGRPLAQGLRLGLSSMLGQGSRYQWLLAASGESLKSGGESIHLGLEHVFHKVLALRAGYSFDVPDPEASLVAWTFGGGLIIGSLSLDYAFVPLPSLGNMQRVSLTYAFGEERDRPAPARKPAPVSKAPAPRAPIATPVPTPASVVAQAAAPSPRGSAADDLELSFSDDDFNRVVPHGEAELLSTAAMSRLDRALADSLASGAKLVVVGRTAMKLSLNDPLHIGSRRANLVRGYLVRKVQPDRVISTVPDTKRSVAKNGIFEVEVR